MKPEFKKNARLGLAAAFVASTLGTIHSFAGSGDNCSQCYMDYDEAVQEANAASDECISGCTPSIPGCEFNCILTRSDAVSAAYAELMSCTDGCSGC